MFSFANSELGSNHPMIKVSSMQLLTPNKKKIDIEDYSDPLKVNQVRLEHFKNYK
mgnify:CR=1 FL=1